MVQSGQFIGQDCTWSCFQDRSGRFFCPNHAKAPNADTTKRAARAKVTHRTNNRFFNAGLDTGNSVCSSWKGTGFSLFSNTSSQFSCVGAISAISSQMTASSSSLSFMLNSFVGTCVDSVVSGSSLVAATTDASPLLAMPNAFPLFGWFVSSTASVIASSISVSSIPESLLSRRRRFAGVDSVARVLFASDLELGPSSSDMLCSSVAMVDSSFEDVFDSHVLFRRNTNRENDFLSCIIRSRSSRKPILNLSSCRTRRTSPTLIPRLSAYSPFKMSLKKQYSSPGHAIAPERMISRNQPGAFFRFTLAPKYFGLFSEICNFTTLHLSIAGRWLTSVSSSDSGTIALFVTPSFLGASKRITMRLNGSLPFNFGFKSVDEPSFHLWLWSFRHKRMSPDKSPRSIALICKFSKWEYCCGIPSSWRKDLFTCPQVRTI
mmetsp:Transcript_11707/g.23788  ORF Transcript_11707/g.23788 Transcript_11707/m.23788 type:complete len:433 (+) Transcript_11707:533-1831(+)